MDHLKEQDQQNVRGVEQMSDLVFFDESVEVYDDRVEGQDLYRVVMGTPVKRAG